MILKFLYLKVLVACIIASGLCTTSSNSKIYLTQGKLENKSAIYKDVKQEDFVDIFIKKTGDAMKLPPLKNKFLNKGSSEIRIFVGGGLFAPRLFILENENGYFNGYSMQDNSRKENIHYIKKRINYSQPNWKKFEREINKLGLAFPFKQPESENLIPILDGEGIYIELKNNNAYYQFMFYKHTENQFGKQMIQICKLVEKRFRFKFL